RYRYCGISIARSGPMEMECVIRLEGSCFCQLPHVTGRIWDGIDSGGAEGGHGWRGISKFLGCSLRWRRSGGITAVHEQARACDEACFWAGDISDEAGNFLRLGVALKCDMLAGTVRKLTVRGIHVRVDWTRLNI